MKRMVFPFSFVQPFQNAGGKQNAFTQMLSCNFFGKFYRKIAHLSLILCFTLLCLLLVGCSLADPAADASDSDLLVGFFITTEPLQPDAVQPLTLAPDADAADGENAAGSGVVDSAETTGSAAYAADALPQALELLPETDCLLVERLCVDTNGAEQVVRTALDRSRNFQLWDTSIGSLVYSVDFSWAQESGRGQTNLYLAVPTPRGTLGERAVELIYDR